MKQGRKRQSENERPDQARRTERPRTYSVSAATGTFHLRWLEYIKKRHDPRIGGLRVA
jgi:hypothetical protein